MQVRKQWEGIFKVLTTKETVNPGFYIQRQYSSKVDTQILWQRKIEDSRTCQICLIRHVSSSFTSRRNMIYFRNLDCQREKYQKATKRRHKNIFILIVLKDNELFKAILILKCYMFIPYVKLKCVTMVT